MRNFAPLSTEFVQLVHQAWHEQRFPISEGHEQAPDVSRLDAVVALNDFSVARYGLLKA
jgi:hypothetical protein